MTHGNGDSEKALPALLSQALRAARAGRQVSIDVLRGAVCVYIDELSAGGCSSDEVRQHVFSAFEEVHAKTPLDPASAWSTDLVDELIKWCHEHQLRPPTPGLVS